jgi:diguanylate cyclase (GGDEF)-like protein/PAS domain S-box-containing protein
MPANFHPLLKRQIGKYLPNPSAINPDFIEAVNESYFSNDEEHKLLERSLEISSEELMQKNSKLTAIFEAFPDIFLRISLDGKILEYKSASINISKILPVELVGLYIQEITALQISSIFEGVIKRIQDTRELFTFEHKVVHENKKIYFEMRIKSFLKDQAIIIIRDITERKVAGEQLEFDALHDRLTSLPNRVFLLNSIENFIARKKRNPKYNFAVMFIDFDHFKLVNDSLGHPAGDILLMEMANRLLKCIREVDTLARLSGDEFCLVLDDIKTEKDAVVVAERIQKLASSPYSVNKREIFMTLSAGIVIGGDDDKMAAEDYIRESDIAMYAAKKNGRAQYVIFDAELERKTIKLLDLEGDFRRALENYEFEVYYQPIVSLPNKEVLRMEALVRWIHPERGIILPNDFIPLAEETGLIFPLGEFVLRRACEECCKWQGEGFPKMGVAVNFSVLQFHHSDISEQINEVLKDTGLNPIYLEVEITESTLMRNVYYTINTLQLLRAMKVKVSIDDFGTGYSALGSLSELPIDSLKIDRKFVHNIPGSQQNTSLTSAIITLGHKLGLKVVCEGIENQEQLDYLISNQCDEAQGYYFSKPMPAAEILKIIKESNIFKIKDKTTN